MGKAIAGILTAVVILGILGYVGYKVVDFLLRQFSTIHPQTLATITTISCAAVISTVVIVWLIRPAVSAPKAWLVTRRLDAYEQLIGGLCGAAAGKDQGEDTEVASGIEPADAVARRLLALVGSARVIRQYRAVCNLVSDNASKESQIRSGIERVVLDMRKDLGEGVRFGVRDRVLCDVLLGSAGSANG